MHVATSLTTIETRPLPRFASLPSGTPASEAADKSVRLRVAQLLERVIFSLLLALIPLTAIPYGMVEPQWRELFVCAVFGLGALWIVESLLSGRPFLRVGQLIYPLFAVALFAFAQTIPLLPSKGGASGVAAWRAISADPYETRLFALDMLALALALALWLRYTTNRRRALALVYMVLGVALASTMFGFLRQSWEGEGTAALIPHMSATMGYGQFINRNHFAFLVEMGLGLVLGLLVGRGLRRGYVIINVAAALILWTGLILANSRGGILSMFGMLMIITMFAAGNLSARTQREEQRTGGWLRRAGTTVLVRAALVIGLLIVISTGANWVGGDALQQRMDNLSNEVHAAGDQHINRLKIWAATWALIKSQPVAGVGFGGYWLAIPEYHHDAGGMSLQQAHNDYLEVLASGGVIGGALLLWFAGALFNSARTALKSRDAFRRATCFGALTGIFGVALHSLFDFGLHAMTNAVILIALVALVGREGHSASARPAVGRAAHNLLTRRLLMKKL